MHKQCVIWVYLIAVKEDFSQCFLMISPKCIIGKSLGIKVCSNTQGAELDLSKDSNSNSI